MSERSYEEWKRAQAYRAGVEDGVRRTQRSLSRCRLLGIDGVPALEQALIELEASLHAAVGEEECARERYRRALEEDGIQAA